MAITPETVGQIRQYQTLIALFNMPAAFALERMDMCGIIHDRQIVPYRAAFEDDWLYAPGIRIAGGTDEILKNIIAERVLKLPGDVRVDTDKPFNELPSGR